MERVGEDNERVAEWAGAGELRGEGVGQQGDYSGFNAPLLLPPPLQDFRDVSTRLLPPPPP